MMDEYLFLLRLRCVRKVLMRLRCERKFFFEGTMSEEILFYFV